MVRLLNHVLETPSGFGGGVEQVRHRPMMKRHPSIPGRHL
jgi:hypothetical protein